jgi:hypothetical protein
MTTVLTKLNVLIGWIEGNTKAYVETELSLTHDSEFCQRCIDKGKHTVNPGKKFLKVVSGGSVRFFVDANTGDIYKPSSFRAPAKGIRGNLFSDKGGREAFYYAGLGLTFVNYAR